MTTVGLTIRATVNTTKIVKEHEKTINQIPQKRYRVAEAVRLSWKCYIPVAVSGGISLGCVIGANNINLKRNAALVATYVATEDKLKHYESKIFNTKASPDKKVEKPVVVDGHKCMCKDNFSGRMFETSLSKIQYAESKLNKMLACEYRITVNELYDELDLDRIDIGEEYGWDLEHGDQIDIEIDAVMDEQYGPVMLISYTPGHYWEL